MSMGFWPWPVSRGITTTVPVMLHGLPLKNAGPAPELALPPLAPRLNLITGDNGLGKSFLLDMAWYCLTRRWPQEVNPGLRRGAMVAAGSQAEGHMARELKSHGIPLSFPSASVPPTSRKTIPSSAVRDRGCLTVLGLNPLPGRRLGCG